MQEMISQKVRTLSPEIDPLRMGMGQTEADLEKPQVMVESTFGDSHPGSAHLLELACVWWKPPLREYAARAGTLRATLLQIYATAWRRDTTASITRSLRGRSLRMPSRSTVWPRLLTQRYTLQAVIRACPRI